MKKKVNLNTKKLVKAIYLLSLAEVLHKRIVMQKIDSLIIKNYFNLCKSKYNPPS